MKRVGILFGMENTFPPALADRINDLSNGSVSAEFARVGGIPDSRKSPYDLIVDRISHDIPFYRSYLKGAAIHGAYVINNPFLWSMDDKFIDSAVAAKAGVAHPRSLLLPSKAQPPNTTPLSMRNLEYPLDWEEIFAYVGFPAFLKPFDGGGWRNVCRVRDADEFFSCYDRSGTQCMMLQEEIAWSAYFRCYCVGRREVRVMPYEPRHSMHLRYAAEFPAAGPELLDRLTHDTLALNRALGYDLNTAEFALRDGVPYAIDFMNPVPDCDYNSVTPENFEWVVDALARFCIETAEEGRTIIGSDAPGNYLNRGFGE